MSKKKIWPVFLALFFLLTACTTAECPTLSSVPPPVSRADSGSESSSAAASAAETSSEGTASEGTSEAVQSEFDAGSSRILSSSRSSSSRMPGSSSKNMLLISSSLTPTAEPRKPMPAVTAKMPEASGSLVFAERGAALDYSNASQGYIMAKYSGTAKIKVLVYFNALSSYYQYDIASSGSYAVLPLQSGSGSYRIRFMENLSGNTYAELCSTQISAQVEGWGCYLYPNQYVSYTLSSAAVAKAKTLCASSTNNAEKVAAIHKFITANVKYDYNKAKSVQSGYLPNVDSTLSSKKGICFDYSALMAAMCRSQGIPAKLVIGNASVGYHAWNEVYLDGWKRYDTTFDAVGQKVKSYTAEKYY